MTDAQTAIDFLRTIYPDGPWVLTAIAPDGPGIVTRTFAPDQEPALRAWLVEHGASHNLYWAVNPPVRPLTKKASRADIAALAWLHVDIDPRAGEELAAERERALRKLTTDLPADVPPPTIIIDSGGGYQGFWRLAETVPINGDIEKAEDAKLWNLQLEIAFGADSCHNIDRIMRLPGTVNRPDAKKRAKGRTEALARAVELHADRVYPIEQFHKAQSKARSPRPARVGSVQDLPVSDEVKVAVEHGHDPNDPSRLPSRSEWLFWVVCELLRAKVDDDTICSVITDERFAISASVIEKSNAGEYARRQVDRARLRIAQDFRTNKGGAPFRDSQHNIRVALAKLGVTVEYDEFADRKLIAGLDGFGPALDDQALTQMRLLIDQRFEFLPPKELFADVVTVVAMENRRHPVREYLDALTWDGTERLDTWLVRYAGVADSEYVRAVGRIVLIAAVRRVRRPGWKFDEMLVLEGPQGSGKSSLLARLAVHDDWFSDDLPLNADTKRQMEALAGKWIVEAGELKGMRRGDVEALKSFLSRQYDRARMAYGREPTEQPRQCVIIGTTNSREYLRDGTGNRRFWPVLAGEIDLELLGRDRDQLWAEAAAREADGEKTTLDRRLWAVASAEQSEREMRDGWEELLESELGDHSGKIRALDLWRLVGVDSERRTQDQNARLGQTMRRLGWERTKARFGDRPEHCYRRGPRGDQRLQVTPTADGLRVEVAHA